MGKGKKESSLEPFWKRLKASRAKIAAVAIDLSAAYQLAVKKHLPEAHVVFDRFHIIKLYNEKLTGLRRALYREATDLRQKKVLKGTRWLLLKRPENLDESRDEHTRLREALERLDRYMKPGGRVVVLSYHSLEDRLVKEAFRQRGKEGLFLAQPAGLLRPSETEVSSNPRSRSARLRAVVRPGGR